MTYKQWAQIIIKSEKTDLEIKNVKLDNGKFYSYGDKDKEIKVKDIEGKLIGKGTEFWLCTCGKGMYGTTGGFDIYTGDDKTIIGHYSWDCPYGSTRNSSIWANLSGSNYTGVASGGHCDEGALGRVDISIDCKQQKDQNGPNGPKN